MDERRRVIDVNVIAPYVLDVGYSDGQRSQVDIEAELHGEIFEPLKNPDFFAQASVNHEQGIVIWPNGAGFSPEFFENVRTREEYARAFEAAFQERGIGPEVLTSIKEAGFVPTLEAESDEDDGPIDLPDDVRRVIDDQFASTPILVTRVILSESNALVEVVPRMINASRGGGILVGVQAQQMAVFPDIVFDFIKMEQHSWRFDPSKPSIIKIGDTLADSTEHVVESVPGSLLGDFTSLIYTLAGRESSKLVVQRKSDDDTL